MNKALREGLSKPLGTTVHPSPKLLAISLFCIGIAVASIWSGIAFGALCMFPMGVVFLHFYLSTYVIGDAGLYQHRRFSWARFVPWEKIGNVALYQGNLEKKFDIGDIQILDAAGKVLMHWRMLPQPERVLNFIAAARALHNLKD